MIVLRVSKAASRTGSFVSATDDSTEGNTNGRYGSNECPITYDIASYRYRPACLRIGSVFFDSKHSHSIVCSRVISLLYCMPSDLDRPASANELALHAFSSFDWRRVVRCAWTYYFALSGKKRASWGIHLQIVLCKKWGDLSKRSTNFS